MPPMETLSEAERSREIIDRLVFDYLVHSGHSKTLRAFVRDMKRRDAVDGEMMQQCNKEPRLASEIATKDPEPLIRRMTKRNEISHEILSGRISKAKDMLEASFPSILSPPITSNTTAETIHTAPTFPSHRTSHDPNHLSLNLRIHAFIEGFRTTPLMYPPDEGKPNSPFQPPTQEQLLIMAQRLYSEASRLENEKDRANYQKEMTSVGGLLAFDIPESSPLAAVYLGQDRRQVVAEQIDNAILYHSNLPPESQIHSITRQMSHVYRLLHESTHLAPPEPFRPPAYLSDPLIAVAVSAKPKKVKEEVEPVAPSIILPFSLREYLDRRH